MIRHRIERDIHALELGFLADGVLGALQALRKLALLSELDCENLREASLLLRGLAEWSGPPTVASTSSLQLSALSSFGYAAEALRSIGTGSINDGLKTYFGSLADGLADAAKTRKASPELIAEASRFFEAMAAATLDRWNASQSPTLLMPR